MMNIFARKLGGGEKLLIALSLTPSMLFFAILFGTWTAPSEVCILGVGVEKLRLAMLILSGISFQACLFYIRRKRAEG